MDPDEFQQWKEQALGAMVKLNAEQTKELLTDFVKRSTLEQREYLHRDLQHVLAQDIMELLPEIRDEIFKYLNIKSLLIMRQVRHEWHEEISKLNRWRKEIEDCGGLVPRKCEQHDSSCHYFFHFYLRLQRVLRKISDGSAFDMESGQHESSLRNIAFCPVACSNTVHACGISHKGMAGFDSDMMTLLWVKAGSLASCVQCAGELILAGSYSGQLKVICQHAKFEHRLQIHSCHVQCMDVSASGDCLLVGYTCGTVHLIREDFNPVSVNLLEKDVSAENVAAAQGLECPGVKVVSVNFLTDPSPQHTDVLAVTVCYYNQIAFALVDKLTGDVRRKFNNARTLLPLTSFCPTISDPCIIYASEGDVDSIQVSVWKIEVGFVEMPGCVEDKLERTVVLHIGDFGPLHVIAAGKRFLMVAIMFDIVIFEFCGKKCRKLATISDFLGNVNMKLIYLNRGQNSLAAVNTGWLDGLSPTTTLPGKLMLIFVRMNCVMQNLVIKTLSWTSGIWGTVAQNVSVGDGIPHFVCLQCGGAKDSEQPGDCSGGSDASRYVGAACSPSTSVTSRIAMNRTHHSKAGMMNLEHNGTSQSAKPVLHDSIPVLPYTVSPMMLSSLCYQQIRRTRGHRLLSCQILDIAKSESWQALARCERLPRLYTILNTSSKREPRPQYSLKNGENTDVDENGQKVGDGERENAHEGPVRLGVWRNAELFHRIVQQQRNTHPALYLERD